MNDSDNGHAVLHEDGTFVDHVGPIRVRADAQGATLRLTVERQHTNPNGGTHGGVLVTLLDLVQGLAVQGALSASGQALSGHPTTIQLGCSFIAGARLGEVLEGSARVDRATRTVSFVSGQLRVGDRLVATGTAVFRNPPVA